MVINVCWAKPSVGEEPFKFVFKFPLLWIVINGSFHQFVNHNEKTTTVETELKLDSRINKMNNKIKCSSIMIM